MIVDTRFIPRERWQETGRFIRDFADWGWYATLTFDDYVHSGEALKTLKSWLRTLAREHVRDHIRVAYCIERTPLCGSWHFHLLIAAPPRLRQQRFGFDVRVAHLAWRQASAAAGFTQFRRYKPGMGASFYLAATEQWEIGVVCSRRSACKRRGCTEGPSPW